MEAAFSKYADSIQHYTAEQLLDECLRLYRRMHDLENALASLRESDTKMSVDFQALLEKTRLLEAEKKHLCEQNQYLLAQRFGSHNEKTGSICGSSGQEYADPLSEDAVPEDPAGKEGSSDGPGGRKAKASAGPEDPDSAARKAAGRLIREALGTARTKSAPSRMDRSKLPHTDNWLLNVRKCNELCGEGNWEIVNWHSKEFLQHPLVTCYVEDRHTPVIRNRTTGELYALPMEDVFYHRSCATSSFIAYMFYEKILKSVPLYTQSVDFGYRGLTIPRQDLSNWFVHFSEEFFSTPYFYMQRLQTARDYAQSDETTLLVLHEEDAGGRKTTTRSFVWVHTTGEFDSEKPIIIYCYEPTRGTDHLRKYYAGFRGALTSDAYISYDVLYRESNGRIILCGCLMHARRRFADALKLVKLNRLTADQIAALPEHRILLKFGRIYDLEGELRSLSPEERLARRRSEIKPLVEELYELIRSVDANDPLTSDKLKDAVSYSLNHKEELCRFLEDGRIPCDNGYCERSIRILARGRRSWLFANTARGADAAMYAYSMVETACQNNANPLIYLKYLLEMVPRYQDLPHASPRLEELMPWSNEYRRYESDQLKEAVNTMVPKSQKKPHYRPYLKQTDAA